MFTDSLSPDTILSAGANADALIDMQNQLRPTAWTLAHIRMTPSEAELYRHLPVLFNVERGFFMEPDEDNLELKICDEHPGYCNLVRDERSAGEWKSVPFARRQIPLVSEEGIRGFLRDCIPQLAEREFCFARICWCAGEYLRLLCDGWGVRLTGVQIPLIDRFSSRNIRSIGI